MEDLGDPELIGALAKLTGSILWPVVVIVLALMFKPEISSLARRIKKGKVLGNEFELSEELDRAALTAAKAQREVYVPGRSSDESEYDQEDLNASEDDVERIISIAVDNPEFGLIFLARKIEEEMKRLLAVGGHLQGRRSLSYRDMAEYLGKNAAVSQSLLKSLQLFWDVRNKIVHGHADVSQDDAIRAIDIGLTVLSAIRAIPHEKNVVAHPGAQIFSDPQGRQPIEGVRALILETTTPGGARKMRRVFPTTKEDYQEGATLTWEWNMNNVWSKCFYQDPWTGEVKKGWESSAEFVGRDIESI